jgi:hypothetical protein
VREALLPLPCHLLLLRLLMELLLHVRPSLLGQGYPWL